MLRCLTGAAGMKWRSNSRQGQRGYVSHQRKQQKQFGSLTMHCLLNQNLRDRLHDHRLYDHLTINDEA
jgi:hypothetical protein